MAGYLYSTDLLMVGKTGTGKSALGNAILQKKAFKSKNSTESVTKTANFDFCQFDGRILKVVDGPGLGDTALDPRKSVELVVDAMSEAICANPTGYHAILLVVRYGGRFTKEDSETVATLKKIFGENFITDHAILVVTCGDSFKTDAQERRQTFKEWCAEQGGVFGQLYKDVQERAILFNNTTKEKDVIYDQVRRLLDMVDGLGARYTSKMFEEAKLTRNRLSGRRFIDEDAIREAGLITQGLSRVDFKKPAEGGRQLQDLKKRADLLFEDILKQDQGTNTLSVAMKMAENLKTTIAEYLEEMQRIVNEKQPKESEHGKIPKAERLTEDKSQNAMIQKTQQEKSDKKGKPERTSVMLRQKEIENFHKTEEKLEKLRLEKERMMSEKQKAEEREMQRAENKRRREEERRAEERARKKDQMDKKKRQQEKEKLAEENRKAVESFKMSMAQLAVEREKDLQEKVARLEKHYREVKEESRSAWMKGAPSIFSKILSGLGLGGKGQQK